MLKKMKAPGLLLICLLVGVTACDIDQSIDPGLLPSVGDVVINEILASNDGVNQDPDYGESGDWVELHNKGAAASDIGGWTISDSGAAWTIPDGTTVPAGGYLLIWCDDLDETGQALHANFKLGSGGDSVTLKDSSGQQRDFHEFGAQDTDISIGRSPDGADNWISFDVPTPAAGNGGGAVTSHGLLINEFLASNDVTNQDPDFSDFSDWVELYNETGADIDISGWTMTDNLDDPAKWTVPAGATVPAGGYLLIWADGLNQSALALHAGFKLGGGGEQVGLYDLGAAVVDTLTYGAQTADISFGRQSDGSDNWTTFATPTPDASNN